MPRTRRRLPAGEAIEHLRLLVAQRRHDRGALPQRRATEPSPARPGAPAADSGETDRRFIQPHGTHLTGGVRTHRPDSCARSEKGNGGPVVVPPSSFGAISRRDVPAEIRPTNSRPPAGRVRRRRALAGSAVASVVPVRGPDARPDGKRGCKTAGRGCDGALKPTSHPDDRSEKNRDPSLGADPRGSHWRRVVRLRCRGKCRLDPAV